MSTAKQYLNAKPSKVPNIGEDVKGAQRHNFLTYEQEQAKKRDLLKAKETKKELSRLKDIALTERTPESLLEYHERALELRHGLTGSMVRQQLKELRPLLIGSQEGRAEFNKKVRAANSFLRIKSKLTSYSSYYFADLLKKLEPKKKASYKESNGKNHDWRLLEPLNKTFKEDQARAIQFGNSVTDKERSAILTLLGSELDVFSSKFPDVKVNHVAFCFGSRGKAGSVAYYQHGKKLISVNRHNIGSLIHELGHAVDFDSGLPSRNISRDVQNKYLAKLRANDIDPNHFRYLMKDVEIFARMFEAYCFKLGCFSSFFLERPMQDVWPDLCDESINLIESVFKVNHLTGKGV